MAEDTSLSQVPADELFFWEQEWQDGERESAEERAAGGLVSFDSPTAAVQWLSEGGPNGR
jgi:hypothetical protein